MSESCGKRESCEGCERLERCGMKCSDACPVIDTVGREVLFINKTRKESCLFALNFGDSIICTCPVRKTRHFA